MSDIDDAVAEIRRARAHYTATCTAMAAALEQLRAACCAARQLDYPLPRTRIAEEAEVHPNTITNWCSPTQKRRGE